MKAVIDRSIVREDVFDPKLMLGKCHIGSLWVRLQVHLVVAPTAVVQALTM